MKNVRLLVGPKRHKQYRQFGKTFTKLTQGGKSRRKLARVPFLLLVLVSRSFSPPELRIYNLPEKKLGKNALTLAYKIMDGTTAILPDGHIPRSQEQEEKVGHEKSWDNYPFLKKIKVRSSLYFRAVMEEA